jgi:hypothetical protein
MMIVERQEHQFRVKTEWFATAWLPDTAANRKVAVVFLRLLEDKEGQPLLSLQRLAAIVASSNAQAASHHIEEFSAAGCDFQALLLRQDRVVNHARLLAALDRKAAGPVNITVPMTKKLKAEVLKLATDQQCNMSDLVRNAIHDYILTHWHDEKFIPAGELRQKLHAAIQILEDFDSFLARNCRSHSA